MQLPFDLLPRFDIDCDNCGMPIAGGMKKYLTL